MKCHVYSCKILEGFKFKCLGVFGNKECGLNMLRKMLGELVVYCVIGVDFM